MNQETRQPDTDMLLCDITPGLRHYFENKRRQLLAEVREIETMLGIVSRQHILEEENKRLRRNQK